MARAEPTPAEPNGSPNGNGPAMREKKDIPDGLWTRCPGCEEMLYRKTVAENAEVCPECGHHFRLGGRRRIEQLADPDSFEELYENVLPFIDVFLPGVDELLLMLHPERYAALMDAGDGDLLSQVDGALLAELSGELQDLGVAVVVLKLGTQGMCLRTTADAARLSGIARILPIAVRIWRDRELLAPAFSADVVGTTGAGDCAIAGFLAGLVRGLSPDDALTSAAAVGASNVEAADAISGVPSWETVQARLAAGWAQHDTLIRLRGWGWDVDRRLWIGPGDRGGLIASSK